MDKLDLYKQLIKSSSSLKYTSRDWFYSRVQTEFRQTQLTHDKALIEKQYEKGIHYLNTQPLI